MRDTPGQGTSGEVHTPGGDAAQEQVADPAQIDSGEADSPNDDNAETQAILDGLAAMPDVQEHAIEAAVADDDKKTEAADFAARAMPNARDSHGRPFDSAIHVVGPDGKPLLTKTGKLRINSAKSKSVFKAPDGSTLPFGAGTTSAAELEAKINSTAQVTAETIFMIGQALGGEEWSPRVDKKEGVDERQSMVSAWATYYRVRGIVDLPPEIIVAVALGGYAVPRFFMPQTKTRVGRAREWFYGWMGRRQARKEEKARHARGDYSVPPVAPAPSTNGQSHVLPGRHVA